MSSVNSLFRKKHIASCTTTLYNNGCPLIHPQYNHHRATECAESCHQTLLKYIVCTHIICEAYFCLALCHRGHLCTLFSWSTSSPQDLSLTIKDYDYESTFWHSYKPISVQSLSTDTKWCGYWSYPSHTDWPDNDFVPIYDLYYLSEKADILHLFIVNIAITWTERLLPFLHGLGKNLGKELFFLKLYQLLHDIKSSSSMSRLFPSSCYLGVKKIRKFDLGNMIGVEESLYSNCGC